MNIIDYTGKINTHEEYIKMLKKLKEKCDYIEIVIIDEREDNELVREFKNDIIEKHKVSKWWGTETQAINNLYKIKSSDDLFKYLEKYETFCKYYVGKKGDTNETTDFGYDDIAFYDKENNYLLMTTTHEGYIAVNESLL